MRNAIFVLGMLLGSITSAGAQVSVRVWTPGVSIGINTPVYPTLVAVPGYPVYYAPQLSSNYFFYDGMYWVFVGDNWYASSWYNGPWMLVAPVAVPAYILRVPVYYYRQPPVYFRAWSPHAPPRWGEHWGNEWAQRRRGWDNWNRNSVPPPAPLPVYQRQYDGNRYPSVEQQSALQREHYRYQPRDAVVQKHYKAQRAQSAPVSSPQAVKGAPQERATAAQPAKKGGDDIQKSAPLQAPSQPAAPVARQVQPQQQAPAQREQQGPQSHGQDKGRAQDKGPEQEPKQHQDKKK